MRLWVTSALLVVTAVSDVTTESHRRAAKQSGSANLIIFLTDTVRPDRMSAYGHQRSTTPVFDAFAERNFLFSHAYATSPWTRPSVASLFTGLYPQRHGVQMRRDKLPASVLTLAERLGEQGMQTVCVTTNPHVTATWGMTRGFDRIVEVMPNKHKLKAGNDARVVYHRVRRLIPDLEPPFFLYVHLIDPHFPYDPPKDDLRALRIRPDTDVTHNLYDGELHSADRYIGRMMRSLDEAELLESSVVVHVADHGEELWDHGHLGHGHTLYQEVMRIPLALRIPPRLEKHVLGKSGTQPSCKRISDNVSLTDLMPTLLSILALDIPAGLDGQDLTPWMRCQTSEPRPLYFSVDKERESYAGVLLGDNKLIVERYSGDSRLYVLSDDPGEQGGGLGDSHSMRALSKYLASLLESFEWSAQPGVHLELAGKDHRQDRRDLLIYLSTSGRFVNIQPRGFEPGDRVQLSDDGSRMHVQAVLSSFWHRSPLHVWVQDRDELSFNIEPRDADIEISIRMNDSYTRTAIVRFPASPSRSWPLRFQRSDLIARGRPSLVDRRLAGVYLYAQGVREPEKLETISKEVAAALEALGYVH